jgi:hypothetical protein
MVELREPARLSAGSRISRRLHHFSGLGLELSYPFQVGADPEVQRDPGSNDYVAPSRANGLRIFLGRCWGWAEAIALPYFKACTQQNVMTLYSREQK